MSLLLEARDEHFAWMLGERAAPDGLTLAPGGVDQPWVYRWLRQVLARLDGPGCWLMVDDGEVVGTCCFKGPPEPDGTASLGYAVALERGGRGYATRAVGEAIDAASLDERIRRIVATTAVDNTASHRVLERNGFEQFGRGYDPDDGEVLLWRISVPFVGRESLKASGGPLRG
ncbi:MAG: GNAT family N-acetyltransferase [Caulobacterales bacterium]